MRSWREGRNIHLLYSLPCKSKHPHSSKPGKREIELLKIRVTERNTIEAQEVENSIAVTDHLLVPFFASHLPLSLILAP